jgi:hypothetical protein
MFSFIFVLICVLLAIYNPVLLLLMIAVWVLWDLCDA